MICYMNVPFYICKWLFIQVIFLFEVEIYSNHSKDGIYLISQKGNWRVACIRARAWGADAGTRNPSNPLLRHKVQSRPLVRSTFWPMKIDLTSGLTLHPGTIFGVFLTVDCWFIDNFGLRSHLLSYIKPCFGTIIGYLSQCSEMILNMVQNLENKWLAR